MYLLPVSVTGNGRGGNQPITIQQSFKNVLPKSLFLLHTFVLPSPPPPLLDKIVPPPGRGGLMLDCLDWLPLTPPASCTCTAALSETLRRRVGASGFSHVANGSDETRQRTENPHLDSVFPKVRF